MIKRKNLREGMQVYGADNQMMGTVERLVGRGVLVKGQHITDYDIARVEGNRVYLKGNAAQYSQLGMGQGARSEVVAPEDEIRVPVREERLDIQKRPAEPGEVDIRKEVVSEQQMVPVELTREEVHVDRREVQDRPATDADLADAFQERTIRVPVRGEEAVVTKQAYVTGEVVIHKERTTETQQITDTIRKERVDVDEN
ncbi:MAG: DUF2382 domain-containing protein [Chloroflexota bacterium]